MKAAPSADPKSSRRSGIIRNYAAWTALSALRSGAPTKSRTAVYPLIAALPLEAVLDDGSPIDGPEFDAWHRWATKEMLERDDRLCVGWAAKIINVYLKTAVYVGGLGRPGLAEVLHPPIDGGLWSGLERRFDDRPEILARTHVVRAIKEIRDFATYDCIIDGCRAAASELGCSLIEVEQLWEGAMPQGASSNVELERVQ